MRNIGQTMKCTMIAVVAGLMPRIASQAVAKPLKVSILALSMMAVPNVRAADLGAGPVKVFILAGQSNMEGYGHIRTLDVLGDHPTKGYLLKKIKKDDGSYVVRDDVFISYRHLMGPLTVVQGGSMGPELTFGITVGDAFKEPVLLIKTAWGGKDLYCDFRPPSAGKPAYTIPGEPRELGACYKKMVEEVHQCLNNIDTDFPKLKGRGYQLCGFVWFHGWNDMCADNAIKQQVFDEYAVNFAHLVHDLRVEFKVPKLLVAVGEVGVGGPCAPGDKGDMARFRAAQAKIVDQPELKGTVGYVQTAPFWYPALSELPGKLWGEECRVRKQATDRIKEAYSGKPEAADEQKMKTLCDEAGNRDLATDAAYLKVKAEHDRHCSHWECHYYGSARIYALVGDALAEAMLQLMNK